MVLLLENKVFQRIEMKQTQTIRKISTVSYSNIGLAAPTAPIIPITDAGKQRLNPDPSSDHRTVKYPIPSFFEYRSKPRD